LFEDADFINGMNLSDDELEESKEIDKEESLFYSHVDMD